MFNFKSDTEPRQDGAEQPGLLESIASAVYSIFTAHQVRAWGEWAVTQQDSPNYADDPQAADR